MIWKHYTMMHNSTVTGTCGHTTIECHFEIGRVHTGKSKVNVGAYCRIKYGDKQLCSEEVTLFLSVHNAAVLLVGITLPIYALHQGFYESGLSNDTGWGYVPDNNKPVLMISACAKGFP
jgi:hypothetical protein